jgi:hypothetical protein
MDIIDEKRKKIYLHNPEIRNNYENIDINDNKFITDFLNDDKLKYKDHVITLLGYTNSINKHTNWYPWFRFLDVFKTIGYKCEWCKINNIKRNGEKRLFITWNEPTCSELIDNGFIKDGDIVFQKLTSLGKGNEGINWTSTPYEWCKTWKWSLFQMFEKYYDKGYDIYGFGCKTNFDNFPEKKRICEKLKSRLYWISWGGTPFNLNQILECTPQMENLQKKCVFIGSKWGCVGRGNIDAWEKYLTPLEKCKVLESSGGIGSKHLTNEEMDIELKKAKICPIIHAPSWQAERGIQDRFYSVFISGRFGICDNLGAIDIFGDELKDICHEEPEKYLEKTLYYMENIEKQEYYIRFIQDKIKQKYNFYAQWYNIMCDKHNF